MIQPLDFAAPLIRKGNRIADGERAARIRKALGLTQVQVAAEIGRSANTVARAERGESDPALLHSHLWARAEHTLRVLRRQWDQLSESDHGVVPEDFAELDAISKQMERIERVLY